MNEPTAADWISALAEATGTLVAAWAALIAVLGVVASTAVAAAAWRSSKRAVDLSEQADRRETARDRERDRARVNDRLAEFVIAANTYSAAMDAHMAERQAILDSHVGAGYMGDPDELDYPVPPDFSRALAQLEAARLVGLPTDREVLLRVTLFARGLDDDDAPIYKRAGAARALIRVVRDWRTGDVEEEQSIAFLNSDHGFFDYP